MSSENVQTIRLETRIWDVQGRDDAETLKDNLRSFPDPDLRFKFTDKSLADLKREVPTNIYNTLFKNLSVGDEYESKVFWEKVNNAIDDIEDYTKKESIKHIISKYVFRQLGNVSPFERLEAKIESLGKVDAQISHKQAKKS